MVPKENIVVKLQHPTYHGATARTSQKLMFIDFTEFNTQ